MQHRTRTLDDRPASFSANSTSRIDIPLDRWVNGINLDVFLDDYDTGTGGSVAEDGILNLIDEVQLIINGQAIRTWAPARYYYRSVLDHGVPPVLDEVTTTQANEKTARVELPIPLRLDPLDRLDLSAALPAHYLSSLEVAIKWGAASDLGSGHTVNSADVVASLSEFQLSRREEASLFGVGGEDVLDPNASSLVAIHESETQKTIDQSFSDFNFTVDLPVGAVLLYDDLYVIDNGARADDHLSKFRLHQTSPDDRTFDKATWAVSQLRDVREHLIQDPIEGKRFLTGHTRLDYTRYVLPGQGNPFNLTARSKGDVQLQGNTEAPTGTSEIRLLHKQARPVSYMG